MICVRYWTVASVIAGLILLSPVVAFLMVMAAEVVIDGLMEAGITGVCAVATGAIGWALLRSMSRHAAAIAPEPANEPVSAEGALATPPI